MKQVLSYRNIFSTLITMISHKNHYITISCRVYLHVDPNTVLPITLTVKVQVALFPDWSTAVYVTR